MRSRASSSYAVASSTDARGQQRLDAQQRACVGVERRELDVQQVLRVQRLVGVADAEHVALHAVGDAAAATTR